MNIINEEEENISKINTVITKSNKLKLCCITWNMHGLNPNQNEIQSLLDPHKNCDIYAIGSEECLRSIFKSLFYSDKSAWESSLRNYFGSNYALIASETLCAIHLVIFIRTSLIKNLSKVRANKVKTGAKNLLGNKGAVGISFSIFNLSIMIINCHLAAYQKRSMQRNMDFQRCIDNMADNYQNFDFVVFMGDLNYRLNNLSVDMEKMENQYLNFLNYDQLTYENNVRRLNLYGFKEGQIYFRPTFKYWNNTNDYQYIDTHNIDQAPAWTDRILFKKNETSINILDVHQDKYDSMPDIIMSDHKPVFSYFTLKFV